MNPSISFVPGAWDLISALTNGETLAKAIAGGVLAIIGVVALSMAIWFAAGKLFTEQSRRTWGQVLGAVVLAAVCIGGGLPLLTDVATGMNTTVGELGKTTVPGGK